MASFIFLAILSYVTIFNCHALVITPQYGVLSEQIGTLSLEPKGSLLFRIEEPSLPPRVNMRPPCYANDTHTFWLAATRQQATTIAQSNKVDLIYLCKLYTSLASTFKKLYHVSQKQIAEIYESMRLLSPDNFNTKTRQERSLFSAMRWLFNVASLSDQKKLKRRVESLEESDWELENQMRGLHFIVTEQNERLVNHSKAIRQLQRFMTNFNRTLSIIDDRLRHQDEAIQYNAQLFHQISSKFNLNLHISDTVLDYARQRLQALALLHNNQLSPILVPVQILRNALIDYNEHLESINSIHRARVDDALGLYYLQNSANFYVNGTTIYIEVDIHFHTNFYHLVQFSSIDTPAGSHVTRLDLQKTYVAISKDHSHYTIMDTTNLKACDVIQGHYYCPGIQIIRPMRADTCIAAIMLHNTTQIDKLCTTRIYTTKHLVPDINPINNSHIAIYNYRNDTLQEVCTHSRFGSTLPPFPIVLHQPRCACRIESQTFKSSPIFVNDCDMSSTQPITVPPSPMINALFSLHVEHPGAPPSRKNASLPLLPFEDLVYVPDGTPLSTITSAYNRNYYHAHRQQHLATNKSIISRHGTLIFSIITAIVIIIIIVVVLGWRTSRLATLFGLSRITPASATPFSNLEQCEPTILYYITLASATLLLIYLIYKYFRHITNIYRNGLELLSCHRFAPSPKTDIILRIASVQHAILLPAGHITSSDASFLVPEDLQMCRLTLQLGWCNNFITTHPARLYISCNGNIFHFPTSFSLKWFQVRTVKKILAKPHTLSVLVGNTGIYRQFKLFDVQPPSPEDVLPSSPIPAPRPIYRHPTEPTHNVMSTAPEPRITPHYAQTTPPNRVSV